MARCGCGASGTTTVAITGDDEGIEVTGAGTIVSPYVVAPVVDPDSDNLLTVGPDGLLALPLPDNITAHAIGNSITGGAPAAGDGGILMILDTQVVLVDASENIVVTFPGGGFPNGLINVVPANGDTNAAGFTIARGAADKTLATVHLTSTGPLLAGTLVRIDYQAYGW